MAITSNDVANRALAQIGNQLSVSGQWPSFTGSGSAAGACNTLYQSVWWMLLREQDYEFARAVAALTVTGQTPIAPWNFAYLYPSDCLKVRQVTPESQSANDPQPVYWTVETQVLSGVPTRTIQCSEQNAQLVYTTSAVTESEWDSSFTEVVVRTLASELAIALGGRPDLSRAKLGEAGSIMESSRGKDS
jgi:hypothetical protein